MSKFVKIAKKFEGNDSDLHPVDIVEGEVVFEYYSAYGFPACIVESNGELLQLPLENIQEVLISGLWLPLNFRF